METNLYPAPEPAGDPGKAFGDEIAKQLNRVRAIYAALGFEYLEEALTDMSDLMHAIGSQFYRMSTHHDSEYRSWIRRSEFTSLLVEDVVTLADEAAAYFEEAYHSGYTRAIAKRKLDKLIVSLENLFEQNEKRRRRQS